MPSLITRRPKRTHWLCVGVVMGLVVLFAHPSRVQAIIVNDGSMPANPIIRGWDQSDLRKCRDIPSPENPDPPEFGARQVNWITEANKPSQEPDTDITIDAGTLSKDLQVNMVAHHCTSIMNLTGIDGDENQLDDRNNWPKVNLRPSSNPILQSIANLVDAGSSMGSISNFPRGDQRFLNFSSGFLYAKEGGDQPAVATFTLGGLSELPPGDYPVAILVNILWVNRYANGDLICVNPPPTSTRPAQETTNESGPGCDSSWAQVNFILHVRNTNPGTVRGRVYNFDTNMPYPNVTIDFCNGLQARTDSRGNFVSPQMAPNTPYCVKVRDGTPLPSGAGSGPYKHPTGSSLSVSQGGGYTTGCEPNSPVPCSAGGYSYQVSQANCFNNSNCGTGRTGGDDRVLSFDRNYAPRDNYDSGYDLVYLNGPPAPTSCESAAVPNMIQHFNFDIHTTPPGPPSAPSSEDTDGDGTPDRSFSWSYQGEQPGPNPHQIHWVRSRPGTPYSVDNTVRSHADNGGAHGVDINYQEFFDAYPYDTHAATVEYEVTTVHTYQLVVSFANGDPSRDANRGGSTASYTVTETKTGTAPTIGPCFYRNYDTQDVSAGSAQFNGGPEDPTASTFSAQVRVRFSVPHNPPAGTRSSFADPSQVRLPYAVTYYIDRALTADSTEQSAGGGTASVIGTRTKSPHDGTGGLSGSSINVTAKAGGSGTFLSPGDRICYKVYVTTRSGGSQEQGRMRPDGSIVDGNGQYISPVFCTPPVVNRPYLGVYGADVSTGGGFGSVNCTYPGSINTWVRLPGGAYGGGASAQLGVLAMGIINEFSSASLRTSAPTPVRGLSFSNTLGGYGGSLGGNHCIQDYFASAPEGLAPQTAPSVTITPANYVRAAGGHREAYLFKPNGGTLQINGTPAGIPNGNQVTFYVDGDVFINSNITYTSTTWSNTGAIPAFYLIAKGNIYLAPGVSNLDGVYIAQPGTSVNKGRIYTCANGTTPVPPEAIYQTCTTPLTVNGAFIAQRVNLMRSAQSSVRYANTSENPNGPAHACELGVNRSLCAAEVFKFSPETYFAEPMLPSLKGGTSGKYDYITSLPPVL